MHSLGDRSWAIPPYVILQKAGQYGQGPVVYWMCREQRVEDKGALLWARQEALIHHFHAQGLEELQEKLNQHNIGFRIRKQSPDAGLPRLCLDTIDAHLLVSDFDPLELYR